LTNDGHIHGKRQFGNYDLIRRIDMGGMGEVYLAHQRTAFHREVGVKIFRDDLSRDPFARTYLQQQPGVNANSVTISIHTMFGDSDLLPSNVSQIKLISIHPTSMPTISLPALRTPAISQGSLTLNT
jgi:hypothetical protein